MHGVAPLLFHGAFSIQRKKRGPAAGLSPLCSAEYSLTERLFKRQSVRGKDQNVARPGFLQPSRAPPPEKYRICKWRSHSEGGTCIDVLYTLRLHAMSGSF